MDRIEERIIDIIDKNSDKIINFAEDIFRNPELGFKEKRTAAKVAENLESLGLPVRTGLAVTGVKGYLKNNKPDRSNREHNPVTVALVGELDAVKAAFHPFADPVTNAAHACGHHAQLATLLGAAIALTDPEIRDSLDGNVEFFAVPAEEYGEIEYKTSLRKKGLIELLGGKPELIRIGEFDDIDIAIGFHTLFNNPEHLVSISSGSSNNGFISKIVRYIGTAAHAAGEPHKGVNALNAAVLGLNALNAQRETFKDSDTVRIHPIITKGGDMVNVVPSEVTIELLVRAKTLEAILDANAKATRAFESGAYAIGAKVEIIDQPGYLPRILDADHSVITNTAVELVGSDEVHVSNKSEHFTGSDDFGDVSQLIPVLAFATGGVEGSAHGADVTVVDPITAYILPAKIAAISIYRLLKDNATEALKVKESFTPKMTKKGYLEYIDSILNHAPLNGSVLE